MVHFLLLLYSVKSTFHKSQAYFFALNPACLRAGVRVVVVVIFCAKLFVRISLRITFQFCLMN